MFEGIDFYGIESQLGDDERMIRDTVRKFVDDEVIPVIGEHYERATFPMEIVPRMAEMGLFGANLPTEYGCAGASNTAYGLILQELERADSGVRSFCSVQGSLVMYPIFAFGSEEHRRRWLPELASGRAIGCFGLTEPDHGSDPGGMKTTARRVDGGYVLDGAKMWITNAPLADVFIVWAKLDGVVRGFLVEKGTPGLLVVEQKMKLSLRASVTGEFSLNEVRVPESNLLPGVQGLKGPLSCLTQARFGIAWGAVGAAAGCLEAAANYAKSRIQFGKPIGSFQIIQAKLADMLTELVKAQLVCMQLVRLKDEGRMTPAQVSLAKRNNVAIALECARQAREIMGANGITLDYHVMRHMCNLETVKTYEGTHDIHTLTLGREMTGISAFA